MALVEFIAEISILYFDFSVIRINPEVALLEGKNVFNFFLLPLFLFLKGEAEVGQASL